MKRWIYIIIPFVVLGSLIGWRVVQKKEEAAGQAKMRAMRMSAPILASTATAGVRDIVHTFEDTGTVESPQNVKIAPKVSGRIEYLTVHEGDRVRRGQVLVRIDPSQVEALVHQQQAAVAEAQYRLAQAKITQNSTGVGVNAQVRQQKAAVSSAKADLNQTTRNYEAQLASAGASVTDAQNRVDNAKSAIKSAQANLDNANAKYNRIYDLYKQGYIAAQDVDDAKAAVAVQQSALEIAQGQLGSATAQRDAAVQQASIVKNKGTADIEASRAKLEQAQASLDYASANTSQTQAYKQSIAALQAGVDAAKAALRSAQAQRADTVLASPLDGFVTGRYMDQGAMATPGQPILSVQFVRQVWVAISVPEEISSMVHIGQLASVAFDALPGRTFAGSVIQFNPSADLQSRQFMARVILSNKDNLFKPGMYAHVKLEIERVKGALCVPREAIQRDKMGPCVVVVEKTNKAKRMPVTTGASDDSFTAIERGVSPGDKVVTMSAFPVRDGATVLSGGKGRRTSPSRFSKEGSKP
jgi:RND family efflux transporter MFP subunit